MMGMEKGDFVNKAIEKNASVSGQTFALLALRLEVKELKEAIQKQTEVMLKTEPEPPIDQRGNAIT